jgi:integrase
LAIVKSYETDKGIRYMVRYRMPDGTTTMKRGFRRKLDATNWMIEKESSKNHGTFVAEAAGMTTIGELEPAWMAKQKTARKPSYMRSLETAWKTHVDPKWGNRQVKSIKAGEVQEWVSDLSERRSASVVLRANGILAGILDDARRDLRIASNPARGLTLPRRDPRAHVYLSADELYALSDACMGGKGHHRSGDDFQRSALVLLLGTVGLRWGEAIGLRWKDVDFGRHRINVRVSATQVGNGVVVGLPKSWEMRKVVFPESLDGLLRRLMDGRDADDLLFTGPLDGYMRRPQPKGNSWYSGAVKRAGLMPMTVHDLRHTAASLMVHSGANVKAVQHQLGHKSAAMTLDVYTDLFDDDLDEVGEAMNAILLRSALKTRSKAQERAA